MSKHPPPAQSGRGAIQARRQDAQTTRRDAGNEVVLQVKEHAVRHEALESAPNGASDGLAITVAMDRPHREEGRQALADCHGAGMVSKNRCRQQKPHEAHHHSVREDFTGDPSLNRSMVPILRQVEDKQPELVMALLPSLVRTMLAAFVEVMEEEQASKPTIP